MKIVGYSTIKSKARARARDQFGLGSMKIVSIMMLEIGWIQMKERQDLLLDSHYQRTQMKKNF